MLAAVWEASSGEQETHHGHVDDNAVALADAEALQCSCKRGGLLQERTVREVCNRVGDRAVVDDRVL